MLDKYKADIIPKLLELDIPPEEDDFLGLIYQCYKLEGDKNIKGAYYTPKKVVKKMLEDLDFSQGQLILDPCCGSSSFLLCNKNVTPNQLFGIDIDPIAVMISKFNLLLAFPEYDFQPQIYCFDFLDTFFSMMSENGSCVMNTKYDYIVTNPPWGALTNDVKNNFPEISSGESFSYFLLQSFNLLKNMGKLRFLFPEAILNVKVHKDIRMFLLNNTNIEKITIYPDSFTGVTTKYVDIQVAKEKPKQNVIVDTLVRKYYMDINSYKKSETLVFNCLNNKDNEIIDSIYFKKQYSLIDSTWALGIVTGNNKDKLSNRPTENWEKIYTGKEICPYILKPAQNYILYDRAQLQQVAKDEIYRAPEKLVYKFISNKLVFAYDCNKSLFLNSANILIPKIPNMSIMTVLAFLNSELYQYLYIKLFGEIKILKGNLMKLPFPELTSNEDTEISNLVNEIVNGDNSIINDIQQLIYNYYSISEAEQLYIRGEINGKANRIAKNSN